MNREEAREAIGKGLLVKLRRGKKTSVGRLIGRNGGMFTFEGRPEQGGGEFLYDGYPSEFSLVPKEG